MFAFITHSLLHSFIPSFLSFFIPSFLHIQSFIHCISLHVLSFHVLGFHFILLDFVAFFHAIVLAFNRCRSFLFVYPGFHLVSHAFMHALIHSSRFLSIHFMSFQFASS